MSQRMTREGWLAGLVEALRNDFARIGFPLPEKIRVSCSWPSRRALAGRLGEAWSHSSSAEGICETWISPLLSDSEQVAAVLGHELVHHAVGVEQGHRGAFARCARAIGLVGPMRSTSAGPALRERLHGLVETLGPYPHAAIVAGGGSSSGKKQTTRMLRIQCPGCTCIVRMARYWLERVGPPTCGCGTAMNGREQA